MDIRLRDESMAGCWEWECWSLESTPEYYQVSRTSGICLATLVKAWGVPVQKSGHAGEVGDEGLRGAQSCA